MKSQYKTGIIIAIVFLFIIASFQIALETLNHTDTTDFVSSDSLVWVSFMRDIFAHPESLSTWRLPPAASWFPDGLIHLIFYPCDFNPNYILVFFILFIITITLISTYAVLQYVNQNSSANPFLYSLFTTSIILLLLRHNNTDNPLITIFMPTFHGSSIAFSLLLFTFIKKSNINKKIIGATLITLLILSDQYIIACFLLPSIITVLINYRKEPTKDVLVFLLFMFLLFVTFPSLNQRVADASGVFISKVDPWEKINYAFVNVLDLNKQIAYWSLLQHENIIITLPPLIFFVFFLLFYRNQNQKRELSGLNHFTLLSILSIYFFHWIITYKQNSFIDRYIIAASYFSIITISCNVYVLFSKKTLFRFSYITLLLMIIIPLTFHFKQKHFTSLPNFMPPSVMCFAKTAKSHQFKAGLSTYWPAKLLREYTRLPINQLTSGGSSFYWNNNAAWVFSKQRTPYNFVITNNFTKKTLESFGAPDAIINCGKYQIYSYAKQQTPLIQKKYRFTLHDLQLFKVATGR